MTSLLTAAGLHPAAENVARFSGKRGILVDQCALVFSVRLETIRRNFLLKEAFGHRTPPRVRIPPRSTWPSLPVSGGRKSPALA
jgi:hypothetical protein